MFDDIVPRLTRHLPLTLHLRLDVLWSEAPLELLD
jgi:hypothetical protein